jgi:hypothetical protein
MEVFIDDVMRGLERDITDAVFLFIEHDEALMERYLRLVEEGTSLQALNSAIGERVKAHFRLTNELNSAGENERNENPRAKIIITSHQRFQPWPR